MRIKTLAVLAMLVIFLTGCAAWMPQMPQTPQEPQDKSVFFMSYYMAQLKDYNARYAKALQDFENDIPVSDMDQAIMSAKYTFLQNAWHPISVYDSYASSGEIPPDGMEEEINSLIGLLENQLKEAQYE